MMIMKQKKGKKYKMTQGIVANSGRYCTFEEKLTVRVGGRDIAKAIK